MYTYTSAHGGFSFYPSFGFCIEARATVASFGPRMFLFGCDMFRFEADMFLCGADMFPFGDHMFLSEADIGFFRKSYVSIVNLVGSSFARHLF